jgi:hypothetical protein
MPNGGGAATNTGIDYQQRLAAYFLIQMLLEIDSLSGIGLEGVYRIISVSFESSSCIDDITVTTEDSNLYIQAKRNINLSDKTDSEFFKTASQFVNQFVNDSQPNDKYILATSSGASSKIRYDLKKISESIRLNEADFKNNPLNKSEQEVYAKIKRCLSAAYQSIVNKAISDTIMTDILKRIYIVTADVQSGMPLEGAILTVLATRSKVKPELLFSTVISLALTLASQRQSINKKGLEDKFEIYLNPNTPEKRLSIEQSFFKIEFSDRDIPSGREILLVNSLSGKADFMIIELFRFDETGNKRMQFYGDTCKTPNGIEWKVIHRTATNEGMLRFVEERDEFFKDKKIAILQSAEDDGSTISFSLAYQELCKSLLRENEQILRCLYCGDFISENNAPLIEVDEVGAEHALGLIHKSCLKPIDRVIGLIKAQLFNEYDYLKDFDYQTWINLAPKGQALFASLQGKPKQVMFMAWNPEGGSEFKGNYCLKINLKDGSSRYVHHRGKIVRYTLSSANERAKFLNLRFEEERQKGDPACYTSKNEDFGRYSDSMKMKDEDEECIECINAEVTEYTMAIEKAYNRFSHYYAPIIILLSKESGQPIVHKSTLFLIHNPLELNQYLKNWAKAGIELPEYKIEIISSDDEFDKLLSKFMMNGIQVVANPLFDMNQKPLSGIVFRHIEELETQTLQG